MASKASLDEGELYHKQVRLAEAFQHVFVACNRLEARFEQLGNLARLKSAEIDMLHHEHRRALEAREIIQLFLEFNTGRSSGRLESMITSTSAASTEQRTRGALILRRLVAVAKTDIPGTDGGRMLIEALAERLENDLLAAFHAAFEQGDMAVMRNAAAVLVTFNGGQSCVQSFIGKHQFFTDPTVPDSIITQHHPTRPRQPISFVECEPVDSTLDTLYKSIVEVVDADWKYVEAVFEQPADVMDALLNRVFHEPVQVHVEAVLRQAQRRNAVAYLRTLHATCCATHELVRRLAASYAQRANAESESVRLVVLQPLATALFSPYVETGAYVELEVRTLADLLQLACAPLQNALLVRRQQASSLALFSRGQSAQGLVPSEMIASAEEYIFAGERALVAVDEGAKGMPSLDVVSRCLTLHAEASVRCYTLLPAARRAAALERLFAVLLAQLVSRYVEAAVDVVLELDSFGLDSGEGFSMSHFTLVECCAQILAAIQTYFQHSLLPVAVEAAPACYKAMVQAKTEAFTRVGDKVDRLLRRELNGILDWFAGNTLGKQKKSDFRPRTEDFEAFNVCSPVRARHRAHGARRARQRQTFCTDWSRCWRHCRTTRLLWPF